MIMRWDDPDCSRDYMYSSCYKVVAQDPEDEIISDICSLKTGVALSILNSELECQQLQRAFSNSGQRRQMGISSYYHILN